jgi:hypothetical protein
MSSTLAPRPSLSSNPRFGTKRRLELPTRGPLDRQVAALLGWPFFPWQTYVADVAGEYHPDSKVPIYRTVGCGVARQNGKTTLVCARIARQLIPPRMRKGAAASSKCTPRLHVSGVPLGSEALHPGEKRSRGFIPPELNLELELQNSVRRSGHMPASPAATFSNHGASDLATPCVGSLAGRYRPSETKRCLGSMDVAPHEDSCSCHVDCRGDQPMQHRWKWHGIMPRRQSHHSSLDRR